MFNGTFYMKLCDEWKGKQIKVNMSISGNGSWVPPPHMKSLSSPKLSYSAEKNIWLFNITDDPNEHNDVSGTMQHIVIDMLELLAQYNKTAVPCRYPAVDPKADPKYHGGYWGPWE